MEKYNHSKKSELDGYLKYQEHGGETQIGKYNAKNEKLLSQKLSSKKEQFYIYWVNSKNKDCKLIGPSTKCFCDHRLKEHNYLDIGETRKVNCLSPKCACKHFCYIPVHGSADFKCGCKHSYQQHKIVTKKCKMCNCEKFKSSWTCSCSLKFGDHVLVVENRQEREKRGKVVKDVEGVGDPTRFGGFNDFIDLVEYGDRFEAKVDKFNEEIEPLENKTSFNALEIYNTPHIY
jgi:hypothetical protein